MSEEIDRATLAKKDLTRLWGIGRVYARHLEESGIGTYDELLAADSINVAGKLHERRCYVSPAQIDRWKHHAKSYATSGPVVFGDLPVLQDSFIALDLEYGPDPLIWLVGVCLVRPGRLRYLALWADTPTEEEGNLKQLCELIEANPALPVVTWNGTGADMPQLRGAVQRLKLDRALGIVDSMHLDLFHCAKRAVRFPIPQLALRQVASYFAIPKISRIRDGLDAQMLYREYRRCQEKDRQVAIKANLLEYNRDDLEALVGVAERIAALRCSWAKPRDALGL